MVDVARFYVAAHEVDIKVSFFLQHVIIVNNQFISICFFIRQVSGNAADLEEDLTAELDIVGRINPDTVWDYIGKMKRASNKDIIILRLQAANDEEKMQYIALYSYLSSRNRFVLYLFGSYLYDIVNKLFLSIVIHLYKLFLFSTCAPNIILDF